jgi:NAD(P)-dependent dehydrogenase (short-subunit alcohol dehydrogenase family)
MFDDLQQKTVLVTGGAQGIGRGIVQELLTLGMNVAFVDLDREAGDEVVNDSQNENLLFTAMDVTHPTEVENAVKQTVDRFGGLHGLVNNAGIAHPVTGPLEDVAVGDWERYIHTNLTGYFLFAKYAIPPLRDAEGAVVNIASTRALQSEPHTEAYAAAKGGVVAFTHALAVSQGPAIRVNCISPGWIETASWQKSSRRNDPRLREIDHQQHPAGRVGAPRDIASLAAYLLSGASSFVTGQNFVVDGGMTKKMIYAE